MSDFDKEAEREKLREKYEQEEKEREATEQMSELLLKGATMTNAHCSDCGDPIFRYDGQEFCPTCQKPVDRGDAEDGDAANGAGDGSVEVTSPSDDAHVQFGAGDDEDDAAETDAANRSEADQSRDEPPAQADESAPDASEPIRRAPSIDPDSSTRIADELPSEQHSRAAEPQHGTTSGAGGDVGSTIAAARASLARSARCFAEAAEGTDDPAVATEYLEAAREAAAALDELD